MGRKILLVEDDRTTADFILKGLAEHGHVGDHCDNGRDGLFMATDGGYDAIVLDRMLPGMDGLALLGALRAAGIETPVILLSALGSVDDRVTGLTAGSDDYLVKPFAFAELLARLELLMRRRGSGTAVETALACGTLHMDLLRREVKRGGRAVDLQPREFRLLEYLLRHAGQVVTRTMLLEGVWDYHFDPGTNVIDVHISSISAIYGWAVLLCNALLCLAYIGSYRALFTPRSGGADGARLVLAGRLIFGGWMLLGGLNYFFLHVYPMPAGHEPLAVQLMTALVHSGLLGIVMAIQLIAGALILAGLFVPLALCVVMPISVCAAYWAVVLEQQLAWAGLALAAVALNGLLMLAHLADYRGVLQRRAYAAGEGPERDMSYESLFVEARGRTARAPFAGALAVLLPVAAFYHFLVYGLPGQWALLVLLLPAAVLHARRLHDMGRAAWWLVLPGIPIAVAAWLHMAGRGEGIAPAVTLAALVAGVGVMLWGLIGKGEAGANRYGEAMP